MDLFFQKFLVIRPPWTFSHDINTGPCFYLFFPQLCLIPLCLFLTFLADISLYVTSSLFLLSPRPLLIFRNPTIPSSLEFNPLELLAICNIFGCLLFWAFFAPSFDFHILDINLFSRLAEFGGVRFFPGRGQHSAWRQSRHCAVRLGFAVSAESLRSVTLPVYSAAVWGEGSSSAAPFLLRDVRSALRSSYFSWFLFHLLYPKH